MKSRREFLRAGLGAGAAFAFPSIIPASAIGRGADGRPAPSGRVTVGLIGCGVEGRTDNLRNFLLCDEAQVISACDVVSEGPLYGYRSELLGGYETARRDINEHYAKKTGKADYNGCKVFRDFREMMEDKDLDAVIVATPDHWHAPIGVWAAKKGIHIYGQKPFANSIGEGRALCNAVKKYGVVFQTGCQGRHAEPYRRLTAEMIRAGRIGELQRVEVGLPSGISSWGKTPEQCSEKPLPKPPDYVDFNLWLGPAPESPFIPALHNPMIWRFNFHYGSGMVTDIGAHVIDGLNWALDMDNSGPIRIENAKCEIDHKSLYNVARTYSFDAIFRYHGRELPVSFSTGFKLDGEDARYSNRFVKFYGEDGKILLHTHGAVKTNPPELIRQKVKPEEVPGMTPGQTHSRHEWNFVRHILHPEIPLMSPAEVGQRAISVAHLANIAFRLDKTTLRWNPETEHFIGDDEAERLVTNPLRAPWSLT